MLQVRTGIKYLIFVYIVLALIIYRIKPSVMFRKDKYKKFGVGPSKTIYSYHIILMLIAFMLFYIFEVIWLKKNNFL